MTLLRRVLAKIFLRKPEEHASGELGGMFIHRQNWVPELRHMVMATSRLPGHDHILNAAQRNAFFHFFFLFFLIGKGQGSFRVFFSSI